MLRTYQRATRPLEDKVSRPNTPYMECAACSDWR